MLRTDSLYLSVVLDNYDLVYYVVRHPSLEAAGGVRVGAVAVAAKGQYFDQSNLLSVFE